MPKKSSGKTPSGSKANRSVRPFGADYMIPAELGHVDRKAQPNVEPKHLGKDLADRSVRPFGADDLMPGQLSHIDRKARPDLVRGRLGEEDFDTPEGDMFTPS